MTDYIYIEESSRGVSPKTWNAFTEMEKEAYIKKFPDSIYGRALGKHTDNLPRFPEINVKLVGEDGNAFSIINRVMNAMHSAGLPQVAIDEFKKQAFSGDYNNLLQTVMEWVSTDNCSSDYDDYDEDYEDEDNEIIVEDDGEKYPSITVKLVGSDGNAFSIIGKVRNALRENKVPTDEIEKFTKEAMSGNYDDLLQTCMRWVNIN